MSEVVEASASAPRPAALQQLAVRAPPEIMAKIEGHVFFAEGVPASDTAIQEWLDDMGKGYHLSQPLGRGFSFELFPLTTRSRRQDSKMLVALISSTIREGLGTRYVVYKKMEKPRTVQGFRDIREAMKFHVEDLLRRGPCPGTPGASACHSLRNRSTPYCSTCCITRAICREILH